jgi:hypothetical protein
LAHEFTDLGVLPCGSGSFGINPLRVIHDFGAIETQVKIGGNEAGNVTESLL